MSCCKFEKPKRPCCKIILENIGLFNAHISEAQVTLRQFILGAGLPEAEQQARLNALDKVLDAISKTGSCAYQVLNCDKRAQECCAEAAEQITLITGNIDGIAAGQGYLHQLQGIITTNPPLNYFTGPTAAQAQGEIDDLIEDYERAINSLLKTVLCTKRSPCEKGACEKPWFEKEECGKPWFEKEECGKPWFEKEEKSWCEKKEKPWCKKEKSWYGESCERKEKPWYLQYKLKEEKSCSSKSSKSSSTYEPKHCKCRKCQSHSKKW